MGWGWVGVGLGLGWGGGSQALESPCVLAMRIRTCACRCLLMRGTVLPLFCRCFARTLPGGGGGTPVVLKKNRWKSDPSHGASWYLKW